MAKPPCKQQTRRRRRRRGRREREKIFNPTHSINNLLQNTNHIYKWSRHAYSVTQIRCPIGRVVPGQPPTHTISCSGQNPIGRVVSGRPPTHAISCSGQILLARSLQVKPTSPLACLGLIMRANHIATSRIDLRTSQRTRWRLPLMVSIYCFYLYMYVFPRTEIPI